ncbi:MAG: hypothetical protein JXQ99_05860 [Hyphomicrobiaceae bacterium]
MTLNWKTGTWRVWLGLSGVWVAGACFFTFAAVWVDWNRQQQWERFETMVPLACKKADPRGTEGPDYQTLWHNKSSSELLEAVSGNEVTSISTTELQMLENELRGREIIRKMRRSLPTGFQIEGCAHWYSMSKFRALYKEYDDLSNGQIIQKTYPKAGLIAPRKSAPFLVLAGKTLLVFLALGMLPPLLLLLIGAWVAWVINGFRQELR